MKPSKIAGIFFAFVACVAQAQSGQSPTHADMQRWVDTTLSQLRATGSSNRLLTAHLLAKWQREPGADTLLAQAYDKGQENPKLLWYVSVNATCTPDRFQECARAVEAAQRLTRTDSTNAMAWLTVAWAADRQLHAPDDAHPELIRDGLTRAATAKTFHDYGFDLSAVFLRETARVPMPSAAVDDVQAQANENARLTLAMMMGQTGQEVVSWLRAGCGDSTGNADIASLCQDAKGLLARGDSARTLSAEPARAQSINASLAQGNQSGAEAVAHARVLIEEILVSSSEDELSRRMKTLHRTAAQN